MLKKIQRYYGIYNGTVIDNADPAKSGRCKIKIWGVYDGVSEQDLPWAWPCFPFGGMSDHGSVYVPVKGDKVFVLFMAGHPDSPVYIGGNPLKNEIPSECDRVNKYMVIKTPGGSSIYVSDAEDEGIKLKSSKGQVVQLDDVAGRIRLSDKSGSYIEMADGNITINPKKKLNLKLGMAIPGVGALGALSSISAISSVTGALTSVVGNLTAVTSLTSQLSKVTNLAQIKTITQNFQKGMSKVQNLTKNLNVSKFTSMAKNLGLKSVPGLSKIGDTLSTIKNVALDKVSGLTSKLNISSLGGLSKLSSMAGGIDFGKITSLAKSSGITSISEFVKKGNIPGFDMGKLSSLSSEFKLDKISDLKAMVGMDFSAVGGMVSGLQDAGISNLTSGLDGLAMAQEIGVDKIKGIGEGLELGGISSMGDGLDIVKGKLDGLDIAGIDPENPMAGLSNIQSQMEAKISSANSVLSSIPSGDYSSLPVENEAIQSEYQSEEERAYAAMEKAKENRQWVKNTLEKEKQYEKIEKDYKAGNITADEYKNGPGGYNDYMAHIRGEG